MGDGTKLNQLSAHLTIYGIKDKKRAIQYYRDFLATPLSLLFHEARASKPSNLIDKLNDMEGIC